MKEKYNSVLTIAGSDSGGCAGIQADIKSISACGAFAATVITATTAQNTVGVHDIHPIPTPHIEAQMDAVLSDITFKAIKIGMLHTTAVIELVKKKLLEYTATNIVLDPVMVASSGDTLLSTSALNTLMQFIPHTNLITPNIPEAELLLATKITFEEMPLAVQALADKFQTSVLLKGGHLCDKKRNMQDLLYDFHAQKLSVIHHPYIETSNIHGTGCSLSSSIAAYLAQDYKLQEAVSKACAYVHKAIIAGKNFVLGAGRGPIKHFF